MIPAAVGRRQAAGPVGGRGRREAWRCCRGLFALVRARSACARCVLHAYDIVFNPGTFNAQPAITGSCVSSSKQAPVFQVYEVNGPKGFTIETRDAHTGKRDSRAFMFTAVGPADD